MVRIASMEGMINTFANTTIIIQNSFYLDSIIRLDIKEHLKFLIKFKVGTAVSFLSRKGKMTVPTE